MGKANLTTGKSRKKKAWGAKHVLASPFAPSIPSPTPSSQEIVIGILAEAFPVPFAQRVSSSTKRSSSPKEVPSKKDADEGVTSTNQRTEQSALLKASPSCKKPEGLLCGINEVTRGLERGTVELVVLSRDVVPSFMIAHIPVLCYISGAKLVVLSGDGSEMGCLLGTKRLLALGIKRMKGEASCYSDACQLLLGKLTPLSTKLDYPWLSITKDVPCSAFPDVQMIPHRGKKDLR